MQNQFRIYNERPISLERRPITFIYHDGEQNRVETISMGPPLFIDRVGVCGSQTITDTHPYITTNPITPKGLAKSARAIACNAALRLSKPISSPKPIFDLRDIEPNNVGHLMHTIIPACLHLRKTVGQETQFLFRPIKPPFRRFLNAFDIEPWITRKSIRGMIIKLIGLRGFSMQNAMHLPDCPAITLFPETFEGYEFKSGIEATSKIFIARRGPRALLNQNDVQRTLEALGYKTIFMEDYSTETQLGIAREATDIVAVHGASLCCSVVNPHINSLIEIVPNHAYHEYFPSAFGNRIDHHIQIMPQLDLSIALSDWSTIVHHKNSPFALPLDQLSLAIDLLAEKIDRAQLNRLPESCAAS